MSADGSAPFVTTPAIGTLIIADVIDLLQRDDGLDPRRGREMCSALRSLCRVLGQDPSLVPADPRHLRAAITKVTAAAAGVSAGRWANMRSLTLAALRHVGIKSMPGRSRERHAPLWEALRARLPDRRCQSGLSRFMSYCTARGIMPDDVTAETFRAFGADLDTHSLSRDPGGVYRDTCKLWNTAAATIPGWPALSVEVPVRRRDFSFEVDAFPLSFREDLERYLSASADTDVFSDTYRKPARPLTLRNRRQNIMMVATALVRSGFQAHQITGLRVLVEFSNAKAALRHLYDRAGGETTGHIYQIATLLKTIARHFVQLEEAKVQRLRDLCSNLKPKTTGLTEKNKNFLRQFADMQKLASLVTLPQRTVGAAARRAIVRRRDAVRVELAMAVAIERVIPIRIDNLAGLRLDRHLQFAGDRTYLSIPAHETKNDNAIEAELSASMTCLLRFYIDRVRPLLIDSPSPWLFPGKGGKRRRSGGFGAQISAFIAKEAGVTMTVHQFRHLAAKLYLDRHPDGFDLVRRLLGHKTRATTERFYHELETVLATKRYGEFLDRLLAEMEVSVRTCRQTTQAREGIIRCGG